MFWGVTTLSSELFLFVPIILIDPEKSINPDSVCIEAVHAGWPCFEKFYMFLEVFYLLQQRVLIAL